MCVMFTLTTTLYLSCYPHVFIQVVLEDNQTEQEGEQIAEDLMKKLDISESDLITNAYIDLLTK